jgi:hypothetical protein
MFELQSLREPTLMMRLGLSTDAPSDSPSIGPCSGTYGEAKLSISDRSSMPTETFTILGDKEYDQAPALWKKKPWKADWAF